MSDTNKNSDRDFETKAIHAGQEYDQWSNLEIVPPLVTSMTFYQNDPTQMDIFILVVVIQRVNLWNDAALDNGKHGLIFPSGCAAVFALLHLLKSGDHILSCVEQYGGTRLLFLDCVKIQGIELDFVSSTDLKSFEQAIKPNTKLIFLETPSNPCSCVSDIAAIAKMARSRTDSNIVVAVDNTLLTFYFQRPLELGEDVVMYSLTKYMNGHNDVSAGALIMNDSEIYKKTKYVQTNYGSVISPFDCYLVNRALKTLALRMRQHNENGLAIAQYLEAHPNVVKVYFTGLPSHPDYELAKKQSSGSCGIVTFQLKGESDDAKKFVQSLRIISSCGSLGSYGSFAMIPEHVSHKSMPKDLKEGLGIFDTTIRLSIGIENAKDLINDLEQAFEKTNNFLADQ